MRNETLLRKNSEFMGYFVNQAKKYSIPGKLDIDDLLQECFLLLSRLLDRYKDIDEDSQEFRRIVFGSVPNFMLNSVRGVKSKNKEIQGVDIQPTLEERNSVDDQEELRSFIDEVESRITGATLQLWRLYKEDPVELWESIQSYNAYHKKERGLKVARKTVNKAIMAFHLNKESLTGELIFAGDKVFTQESDTPHTVVHIKQEQGLAVLDVDGVLRKVRINTLRRSWTTKKVIGHLSKIREAASRAKLKDI